MTIKAVWEARFSAIVYKTGSGKGWTTMDIINIIIGIPLGYIMWRALRWWGTTAFAIILFYAHYEADYVSALRMGGTKFHPDD